MRINEVIEELEEQLSPDIVSLTHHGEGGQGTVFKGRQGDEDVAVKIFYPEDDRRRVERELGFLTRHEHEHLVRVLGFSQVSIVDKECVAVVYEFIPGGDLRAKINSAEHFTSDLVLTVGAQIGAAIEFLWKNHIVHRDIKPENVFVKSMGGFVLGDIGFASHLDLSTITPMNMIVGTKGYRAPEQQAGRRLLTIHADLFGLGVTLYELAALAHPFLHDQAKIGNETPSPLGQLRSDLSPELTGLIDKMLNVRPARRPTRVSERFLTLLKGD